MKKKIGKRNRINLSMPDRLGRVKIKSVTYTKSGIINDLECQECDGDGHTLQDNTSAKGGEMIPSLCSYCDGTGDVILKKVDDILFDDDGNPIIKYIESVNNGSDELH